MYKTSRVHLERENVKITTNMFKKIQKFRYVNKSIYSDKPLKKFNHHNQYLKDLFFLRYNVNFPSKNKLNGNYKTIK